MNKDLTIIYYTANATPEAFAQKTRQTLEIARGGLPLISVSQIPMFFGKNICVGSIGRTHLNIYRQALIGAKAAETKYIALAEDDILYSPEHFQFRPSKGLFAYNMSVWSLYTWVKPAIFSYKDRRNLSGLICERELFIEAMEERFKQWPDDSKTPIRNWAEPGKYEDNLGVTMRETEKFYTDVPNVAFSHPTALSYEGLGHRKKLGNLKAISIPFWGTAEEVLKIYEV